MTATIISAPASVSGTLAAVGHFGVAACYAVGVATGLADDFEPLFVLTPMLAIFLIVLGAGWLTARRAFGPAATTSGILCLVSPPLAAVVGVVVGQGRGDFAALGGIVMAGAVVAILEIAADIAMAVALGGRLARDGRAARVALWAAAAPGPVALLGFAVGPSSGAAGLGLIAVGLVLAAVAHVAAGIVCARLATRTRPG